MESWELVMTCAQGAWCRNPKVNRGQNQLTMSISTFPVFSWELVTCALGAWCGNHKVNRGQNQLTMSISTLPGLLLRAHAMCPGGLVSKPQGEPGSKPAYNVNFYAPCFWLRAHDMCSGGLVSKPQGEPGSKPAYSMNFYVPVSLVESSCHMLYRPVHFPKNQQRTTRIRDGKEKTVGKWLQRLQRPSHQLDWGRTQAGKKENGHQLPGQVKRRRETQWGGTKPSGGPRSRVATGRQQGTTAKGGFLQASRLQQVTATGKTERVNEKWWVHGG